MTRRKHPDEIERKVFPAVAILEWLNCDSDAQAAEILGMQRGSCSRWRTDQRMMTASEADRWAGRLRVHPTDIWADWYSAELTPA